MKKINLFPSTIGIYKVEEDISSLFFYLKAADYHSIDRAYSNLCSSTKDIMILNKFSDIKVLLLSYFNIFKNNTLSYRSTNFTITTSWGTKTDTNQYSNFHTHKNSFFSAVLYFESSDEGGYLELNDNVRPSSFFITPDVNTFETCDAYAIKPESNLLVFFPSYLRHRISIYHGVKTRYSLAFNIVPIGHYGTGDSSLTTIIDT